MKVYLSPAVGLGCLLSIAPITNGVQCKDTSTLGLIDTLFFHISAIVEDEQAQEAQRGEGVPQSSEETSLLGSSRKSRSVEATPQAAFRSAKTD